MSTRLARARARARRAGAPPRPRTAFVLSGGGNQGVSQVGMLRALIERGITPDVVIGTSAGALNGAAVCYAPNLTGIARLAEVWSELEGSEVFPGGALQRAWNILRRDTHLFDSDGLEALIDRATPARTFADLAIPLRVVATDLDTGDEVLLARGPLKPALLASAALPGVFPIVQHDGRRLVDGGVVDSVPLSHALAGPVDRVFVMNVSAGNHERPMRSPLDVVMTSFLHARSLRYELERRLAPVGVDIIDLPRPIDARDLFDFSGAEELMAEAYQSTSAALDEVVVPASEEQAKRWRRSWRRARSRTEKPKPAVQAGDESKQPESADSSEPAEVA